MADEDDKHKGPGRLRRSARASRRTFTGGIEDSFRSNLTANPALWGKDEWSSLLNAFKRPPPIDVAQLDEEQRFWATPDEWPAPLREYLTGNACLMLMVILTLLAASIGAVVRGALDGTASDLARYSMVFCGLGGVLLTGALSLRTISDIIFLRSGTRLPLLALMGSPTRLWPFARGEFTAFLRGLPTHLNTVRRVHADLRRARGGGRGVMLGRLTLVVAGLLLAWALLVFLLA